MVKATSAPSTQVTQDAMLQGVKQHKAWGRIMPAGWTSHAVPNGSCGPQVLVATIAVDVQGDPWHG